MLKEKTICLKFVVKFLLNYRKADLLSCTLSTGDRNLSCPGGKRARQAVQPETNMCLIRELIIQWNKAGFEYIFFSEKRVKKRVLKLLNDYRA